jgi:hypothetical protein
MSQLHRVSYLITCIAKYSNHSVSSLLSSLPVIIILDIIKELGYLSQYSDRLLVGWPVFDSQEQDFSLLQCSDWPGGPPSLLSGGYWGLFLRGKATSAWKWPLTSISCQSQEWWSYTSTTPYIFMAQGQLYLYLTYDSVGLKTLQTFNFL